MDTDFGIKPINKTLCRVLGEDYNAVADQTLNALKAKFIAREQRKGNPNPESAWVKAEPTYRNMLLNDPNIKQDLEQRHARGAAGGAPAPAAGGGGPSGMAQEIYGLAEQIRGSVSPEQQDAVHRIMQLAMELANTGGQQAA